MTEELVLVEVYEGVARLDRLHLPRPERTWGASGAVRFVDRVAAGPPNSWPTACGHLPHGWVYVRGGPLAELPICVDCLEALGEV